MKYRFIFLLLLITFQISAQDVKPEAKTPSIDKYWFVMIKTGLNTSLDSLQRNELFKGHMANMQRLADDGILKIAGPFGKNEFQWRGIFIFDCKTLQEAEQYVNTDPAVKAGLFAVDIVPWYSAPEGNLQHTRKSVQE